MNTIKRYVSSGLLQNVSALACVQAINYLVPFFTLPYLTRVLGPVEWGLVAWMQVIVSYFTIFTDWGFSWGGVRNVAAIRDDTDRLSEYFFAGWLIQWSLCLIALAVLFGMSFFGSFFLPFRPFTLYGAGAIVSGVLFPLWFLVGLERLREVAVVQLIVRVSAVPLIFLMVHKPGDGPLVIAISSATGLLGGVIALVWIYRNVRLIPLIPRSVVIQATFLESGSFFFARAWTVLYTALTPTVLGSMTNVATVGYYALADKIRFAVQSLLQPLSQALFPRMSYLFSHDRPAALHLLFRSSKLIISLAIAVSVCLFLFAKPAVLFLGGHKFLPAVEILRWLAPVPLWIALSNVFGIQILLPNGMGKTFNATLMIAGLLSLVFVAIWISHYGGVGAAINTMTIEGFVAIAMVICVLARWKHIGGVHD